jgi:hypothetical protein
MQQLMLLAAQLAGVADMFVDLIPKWALGELYDHIMRLSVGETSMTRIRFQDWLSSVYLVDSILVFVAPSLPSAKL